MLQNKTRRQYSISSVFIAKLIFTMVFVFYNWRNCKLPFSQDFSRGKLNRWKVCLYNDYDVVFLLALISNC